MTQPLRSPARPPADALTVVAADPLTNAEVDRLDAAPGRAPALHPLLGFALQDDSLFRDPFASFAPSRR